MSRHLPPLTALRALEAAGRHVNFSRAAEELSVTPGAISRQIRFLESYLGMQLFDRSNGKLLLTENAAEYVRALTDAFTRIENASERLQNTKRHRQLNIATSMTFALRWLVPRLPQFNAAHPDLELRLSMAAYPLAVTDGADVDMAIVINNSQRQKMVCEWIFDNELIVVCSPALLRASPGLTPANLGESKLLTSALRPDDWSLWFSAMNVHGAQELKNTTFANSTLVYQAAQAGLGFAVARFPLVLDDLTSGSLVPAFPTVLVESVGYHMIYNNLTDSPKLRALREWVKSEAATYLAAANRYTQGMTRIRVEPEAA